MKYFTFNTDEMKEYRGTLYEPGRDSPYRTRSIDENLQLFRDMRAGKFSDGHCVLRAKIDMNSPYVHLRDPTLYRIKKEPHPMTGSDWCIYPMYDFAHAISDALEGITHSLCTLEFASHRPLYDWIVDNLLPSGLLPYRDEGWRPHQYEFSRLNVQYTVLSKRKLITLVTQKHVQGWDDPRMPTISGLRRRGYPATALRLFVDRVGISKAEANIDASNLEGCAREVLERDAPRLFAVTHPLKVKITNWDRVEPEIFSVEHHHERTELGCRDVPFTGELYIDREDFFDTKADLAQADSAVTVVPPPRGYKRLLLGGQVRLRNAYVVTCHEVRRDEAGEVIELVCTYDPATRAGKTPPGAAKVKGIIQWVSQHAAVPVDLYQYDRLFLQPSPGQDQADGDFLLDLNPHSLELVHGAVVESAVLSALQEPALLKNCAERGLAPGTFQFERVGYFALDTPAVVQPDSDESVPFTDRLRFNRIVTLKDTWQNAFLTVEDANDTTTGGTPTTMKAVPDSTSSGTSATAGPAVEDVRRVELRVGQILSAEQHPEADSLYILNVRVAEEAGEGVDSTAGGAVRTILSGLAGYIPLDSLVSRKVVVVCNLKPSKMRGIVSEGMLLAASGVVAGNDQQVVELLAPPEGALVGELISVSGYEAPAPDAVLKSKSAQEVWKRVCGELRTDSRGQACYGPNGGMLQTSAGPCRVNTLFGARIG
jgi:glutaminyl-tRNA synthetase